MNFPDLTCRGLQAACSAPFPHSWPRFWEGWELLVLYLRLCDSWGDGLQSRNTGKPTHRRGHCEEVHPTTTQTVWTLAWLHAADRLSCSCHWSRTLSTLALALEPQDLVLWLLASPQSSVALCSFCVLRSASRPGKRS
jgi:hypothetical protein